MSNSYSKMKHFLAPEEFGSEVKKRIKRNAETGDELVVATLDIDHFNYINDLFGYETGDLILEKLAGHFSRHLKEGEFFTRLHADIFAFCMGNANYEAVSKHFKEIIQWEHILKAILPTQYSITASGGVVLVKDGSKPVSALLDKASYAREKAKGSATSSFRVYDEKMEEEQQWQKIVTFSMESALKNREFEMYLQPKVYIKDGRLVGAEALVRWNTPEYGLVPPDRFIPILEQNGFIKQLDFFMLEEACRFLKESAAAGLSKVPISINFSKAHLTTDNLVERIFQTVNKTGVNTKYIEIEFTESLSVEGFERLIEVVIDLKLLGFRVSLDDFGSAYSSLNCLKELPIDLIKIDKGFLNASSNSEKGKLIIAKVVELIKSLRMLSVMEGVETIEQADFLKKLSCDFGQGYFYARPMSAEAYRVYLAKGEHVPEYQMDLTPWWEDENKSYLQVIPQEFQMDNWELYTLGKNIDMGLMKGYLDGEATVQYVNDRALEYLGYSRQEFREVFHNSIVAFTHPEDAHIVQKNAHQLITSGRPLQFQTRAIRKDGKVIILQGRSSCVIDSDGRPVGIYAFQDVTEELEQRAILNQSLEDKIKELEKMVEAEREAREAHRLSEERYRVVLEQSDDILFDWDFQSDTIFFSGKYLEVFEQEPILENLVDNPRIRERIHPEDLPIFEDWISSTYKHAGCSETEFRNIDAKGEYLWLRCHSTAICDENGNALRAVGLITNVSDQKEALEALTFKSQRDPLTKLFNREEFQARTKALLQNNPTVPGAFFIFDIDDFKRLNDALGHQLGDTVLVEFAEKILAHFPENSIVGRIGGDEFAAFQQGLPISQVPRRAEQLAQSLRVTYYGSAARYNIYGSAGIACSPVHGTELEELYRFADIALYESKRKGKDCYTIYQEHMTGLLKDNRTPVDWSESFLNTYFQEDFPFKIFEILYETKDMSVTIQLALELLGKYFHMDRVYIFQNDPGGLSVSNTYEWCAPGIPSAIDGLQHVAYSELGAYLTQYSKEGVFCCPDIRLTTKEVYEICSPQGIKSLLHCAIYNAGSMTGFIGFDMCAEYHNWTGEEIAILGYISRILSVFLIQSSTDQKLRTSCANYMGMLDNLNGYVYVVEPITHKLLYVNNTVKKLGVESGPTCHKMAFHRDTPCVNCPIGKLSETICYATEEIYSDLLQGWVHTAASKLKWGNGIDAVLICCTDISKYKKDVPSEEKIPNFIK